MKARRAGGEGAGEGDVDLIALAAVAEVRAAFDDGRPGRLTEGAAFELRRTRACSL